ncbi:uncharacterized protein LOC128546450 [Mercenaria mercenaria]|uniref:uncharacterized protein LOC128546450 n=1 Tax=Mercenaria mercenaria TaxID=6596 RepID=UPI00234F7D7F|nr:uncharacterized protein LOC128546450 [Mercenaria mercenaria]
MDNFKTIVSSKTPRLSITGIDFTISRDRVVIGSTGTLTLTCDVTENDVQTIYLIQILRETVSGSGIFESVVEMENSEGPVLKVTNNKDFVAEGTYDARNTYLSVSMNISKLQCNDAKAYKCVLIYKSTTVSTPLALEKNGTFSAYVYPEIRQLDGKRNGFPVQGLSSDNPAVFDVGAVLELSCTANIGSKPETKIRWRKTPEMGTMDDFIGYQPEAGTTDEGTAISDNQCGYTRVATITYNTTVNGANRAEDNRLAFECYVSVSGNPYGTTYITQNNPRFYADVSGSDQANRGLESHHGICPVMIRKVYKQTPTHSYTVYTLSGGAPNKPEKRQALFLKAYNSDLRAFLKNFSARYFRKLGISGFM